MDQVDTEKTIKCFLSMNRPKAGVEIILIADRGSEKEGDVTKIGVHVSFSGNALLMFDLSPEAARELSARLTIANTFLHETKGMEPGIGHIQHPEFA